MVGNRLVSQLWGAHVQRTRVRAKKQRRQSHLTGLAFRRAQEARAGHVMELHGAAAPWMEHTGRWVVMRVCEHVCTRAGRAPGTRPWRTWCRLAREEDYGEGNDTEREWEEQLLTRGSRDTTRRPGDEGEGDDELLVGATSSGPRSRGSRGRRRRWTWGLRPWIAAGTGSWRCRGARRGRRADVGAPSQEESSGSPRPWQSEAR